MTKNACLFRAVENNNMREFKKLVKEGADVNSVDRFGDSILILATKFRFLEIAKLAIYSGADVDVVDYMGKTALHILAERRSTNILGSRFGKQKGDEEFAKLLINRGANIDKKDDIGRTPCHIADQAEDFLFSIFLNTCYALFISNKDYTNFDITAFLVSSNSQINTIDLNNKKRKIDESSYTDQIMQKRKSSKGNFNPDLFFK